MALFGVGGWLFVLAFFCCFFLCDRCLCFVGLCFTLLRGSGGFFLIVCD
jgi:hypothetical protein